jgi:hypothetical protein
VAGRVGKVIAAVGEHRELARRRARAGNPGRGRRRTTGGSGLRTRGIGVGFSVGSWR